MSTSESHSLRNGIVATVVGGIILAALGYLWAPAKAVFYWLGRVLALVWSMFVAGYRVPGWLLLVFVLVAAAVTFGLSV